VRHALRSTGMLLVLAGYSLAYFGVPLPRPSEKDLSKPFPCATRACGCMSAESCWKDCCCFTLEQKLAWAAENGVEAPQWLLAETRPLARRASEGCCSQKVATPTCCQRTPGAGTADRWSAYGSPEACCSAAAKLEIRNQKSEIASTRACCDQPKPPTKTSGWVFGMQARKCKGQGTDWLALASVLPAPPRVMWHPNIIAIERTTISACMFERIFLDPPTPPPRLS